MLIGERLRELREQHHLSQGDIEKRTGLLRCYTSRVENGRTVPSVATLEKLADALEVPLYHFFHDGKDKPQALKLKGRNGGWGASNKDLETIGKFRRVLRRVSQNDLKLLLFMAQKLSQGRESSR